MIIKKISIRNFKSFGNNKQTVNFRTDKGELILLTGGNGAGKCLSPDTEIDIFIESQDINDTLQEFLRNRKKPLYPVNIYNKNSDMRLLNDKFFKNFNVDYIMFLEQEYKNKPTIFIKNEISEEIKKLQIKNNIKQIKERNIDYWLIRGWSFEEAELKIIKINSNRKKPTNNSILMVEYWINKGYNENDARKIISEEQRKRSIKGIKKRNNNLRYKSKLSPFTPEYWIKMGLTDMQIIKKKMSSFRKNNVEYWLSNGYNLAEAKDKVSEYQKIAGGADRTSDKNSYEYKKTKNTCIEYYLSKGYSYEESEYQLIERQKTFTLEKCIDKYGIDEGTKIFNKRQQDWIKKMFNENTCMAAGRSMICDKFIEQLILNINDKKITDEFLYGINEKFIFDNLDKKGKRYDLCYNKKIIEFYGDFWHCNPKIFKDDDIHKIKKIKASEIWKQDNRKIKSAHEHNYDVLIIWESDYINNSTDIINKSKLFLIDEN